MNTIQLSSSWDLMVDANGSIAMATGGYAIAQNVASAIAVFLGELYYDTTLGVDYAQILGAMEDTTFIRTQLETAALTVPGVVKAKVTLNPMSNNTLSGTVQIIDTTGQALNVVFGG